MGNKTGSKKEDERKRIRGSERRELIKVRQEKESEKREGRKEKLRVRKEQRKGN